ncbi:hypothetical protein GQ457_05G002430 [Hibiscus cannabinus]
MVSNKIGQCFAANNFIWTNEKLICFITVRNEFPHTILTLNKCESHLNMHCISRIGDGAVLHRSKHRCHRTSPRTTYRRRPHAHLRQATSSTTHGCRTSYSLVTAAKKGGSSLLEFALQVFIAAPAVGINGRPDSQRQDGNRSRHPRHHCSPVTELQSALGILGRRFSFGLWRLPFSIFTKVDVS